MRQDELEKAVSSLKTQQAAMRRDLKTAFRRIEEQTRLTDTVHQLALSIRDLANKQEHIQQDVQRIRGDVDELKGKPGKHWDAVALELSKSALLAAAGYSGAMVDDRLAEVFYGRTWAYLRGKVADAARLAKLAQELARPELAVTVDLHLGPHSATIYTCDLSLDYVHINADYTT